MPQRRGRAARGLWGNVTDRRNDKVPPAYLVPVASGLAGRAPGAVLTFRLAGPVGIGRAGESGQRPEDRAELHDSLVGAKREQHQVANALWIALSRASDLNDSPCDDCS
jgi:hypothetical protein